MSAFPTTDGTKEKSKIERNKTQTKKEKLIQKEGHKGHKRIEAPTNRSESGTQHVCNNHRQVEMTKCSGGNIGSNLHDRKEGRSI